MLADYVEFSEGAAPPAASSGVDPSGFEPAPVGGTKPSTLRKGMTVADVNAALGRPDSCSEKAEGVFKVTVCKYRSNETEVEGQFIEGILMRYTIASQ